MKILQRDYLQNQYVLERIVPKITGRHIAISGSSGFLGKNWINFFEELNLELSLNLKVTGYDLNFPSAIKNTPTTTYRVCDVSKGIDVDTPVDYFIHAASIASPITYRKYPLETTYANIQGTENVLKLAKNGMIGKVGLLSTSEIYGNPDPQHIPTKEDYNGNVSFSGPRACYDESKRMLETLNWIYVNQFGIDSVTIRPFNVYGPGQSLDDGRILPDIMKSIANNSTFSLHSDGKPTRTFCYISDFIIGSMSALLFGQSGEGYNVGNDKPEISIRDLLALTNVVLNDLGHPVLSANFVESEDKHYLTDNPMRRCPDIEKLAQLTNWQPVIPLELGLENSIRYYLGESK